MPQRIVVVGHSALTCLGRDMDTTWRGLIAGRSGLRRQAALTPELFLQDVAGMVEGFGPGTAGEDPAVVKLPAAPRCTWPWRPSAGLGSRRGRGVGRRGFPERVAVMVGGLGPGWHHLLCGQDGAGSRGPAEPRGKPGLDPGSIIEQGGRADRRALEFQELEHSPANACVSGGHAIALGAMYLPRARPTWPSAARRTRLHDAGR